MQPSLFSSLIARALATALVALAMVTGSCSDPVHQSQVDQLGGESPGVPIGEFHRAGQPCLVCHGGLGPADSEFSVAGTVFYRKYVRKQKALGVENAKVQFLDSSGKVVDDNFTGQSFVTNCAGNFFVAKDRFDPVFPLRVRVQWSGPAGVITQKMNTQIGRDGSCATCHFDPPNSFYTGHVYMVEDDSEEPPINPNCPINPHVTVGQ